MTQEEAISEGFEAVTKELARLNAKIQNLIDMANEGLPVVVIKE
jgi:hypothetical protein